MVYLKNLLPLQIIKKWNYDSSVHSQLFLPRYCDSLRQDWRRKVCLQGSGTDIFFLCLALHSSFSETLIKCVSVRCLSPFSCFLLHRSTARRTKYPSTVAQESGFKVFINHSPPAVAVSLTEQMLSLDESSSPPELALPNMSGKAAWEYPLGLHTEVMAVISNILLTFCKENETSMLSATSTGLLRPHKMPLFSSQLQSSAVSLSVSGQWKLSLASWLRVCALTISWLFLVCIWEGFWRRKWQSTPVLCLDNSMDGGAGQTTVHGIAISHTWLWN